MKSSDSRVKFAGGSKGPNARGDGDGGFLARGFWFDAGSALIGPFDTEAQASLVASMETSGGGLRRLHEVDLYAGELAALRALRRKGVIETFCLRLKPSARAALTLPIRFTRVA